MKEQIMPTYKGKLYIDQSRLYPMEEEAAKYQERFRLWGIDWEITEKTQGVPVGLALRYHKDTYNLDHRIPLTLLHELGIETKGITRDTAWAITTNDECEDFNELYNSMGLGDIVGVLSWAPMALPMLWPLEILEKYPERGTMVLELKNDVTLLLTVDQRSHNGSTFERMLEIAKVNKVPNELDDHTIIDLENDPTKSVSEAVEKEQRYKLQLRAGKIFAETLLDGLSVEEATGLIEELENHYRTVSV